MNIETAIEILKNATSKGARFLALDYTKKGDGEKSHYVVNFGVSYENAMASDLEAIRAFEPTTDMERTVKAKIQTSLEKFFAGEKSNQAKAQAEAFDKIGNGLRQHTGTKELYIWAKVASKTVLSPATNPKKPTNHGEIALAEKAMKKALGFKSVGYAQFLVNPSLLAQIKVNGETITLE